MGVVEWWHGSRAFVPAEVFGGFHAVQGLDLGVDRGSSCMLGHNGAGKTTTINMLTGIYQSQAVMPQSMTSLSQRHGRYPCHHGICPQHDVLWDQLTGMEHLMLFARLHEVPHEGGAIQKPQSASSRLSMGGSNVRVELTREA